MIGSAHIELQLLNIKYDWGADWSVWSDVVQVWSNYCTHHNHRDHSIHLNFCFRLNSLFYCLAVCRQFAIINLFDFCFVDWFGLVNVEVELSILILVGCKTIPRRLIVRKHVIIFLFHGSDFLLDFEFQSLQLLHQLLLSSLCFLNLSHVRFIFRSFILAEHVLRFFYGGFGIANRSEGNWLLTSKLFDWTFYQAHSILASYLIEFINSFATFILSITLLTFF